MEAARWGRVREVFDAVLAQPVENRAVAIAELSGGNAALAAEVWTLLDAHAESGGFLEHPAWDVEAAAPPDPGLDSGDRLGPWRIVDFLGEGGMGVVYRAVRDDGAFDREVAIKRVRFESPALRARFKAERQILADLDHPGIARLLDAGTAPDGHPYFVLELVDGIPIDRWCAEHAAPVRDRLDVFVEVCAAVSFAHQRLVLHRDIKPSNILVTPAGEPKLLDFGIAKLLDPATGGERATTRTALRAFTPEYASPEQHAGEPLDTSSDVWSLGVVLFRLLTGLAPYGTATLARVAEPHERSTVLPPSASAVLRSLRDGDDGAAAASWPIGPQQLSGDLDVILGRALEPDRARRYRTVAELEDDLRRHLDGRPVLARPPSAAYLLLSFARRNRVAVATAALSAVGLVAAAAVSRRQASVARRQRDLAARRFAAGREMANKFLFDVHDAIAGTAGTTEARERMARTGIQYLDRLAAEAGDNETLQREIARGYDRLGLLQGAMQESNLGQTGAGLESFEKASSLRRRMLDRDAAEDDLVREVAQGELGLAQALLTAGQHGKAPKHSAAALKLHRQLAADRPNDREAAIGLGHALATHGYAVTVAGERERGVPYLRRAVRMLEPLQAGSEPGDRAARAYTLATQRLALALAELPKGRGRAEALEILPRAIAIDRWALATDPNQADRRRDLSRDAGLLAQLLAQEGRHREALDGFQEVERVLEEEIRLDADDRMARRNLGAVRSSMARSLVATGREDEALAIVEPILDLLEADLAVDADNVMLQVTVAELATRLGEALLEQARRAPAGARAAARAAAGPALARAIVILQALVQGGMLPGEDAAVLNQARAALARCHRS